MSIVMFYVKIYQSNLFCKKSSVNEDSLLEPVKQLLYRIMLINGFGFKKTKFRTFSFKNLLKTLLTVLLIIYFETVK